MLLSERRINLARVIVCTHHILAYDSLAYVANRPLRSRQKITHTRMTVVYKEEIES